MKDEQDRIEIEGHRLRLLSQPGETSWAAVDLEPYKRGDIVIDPPVFFLRDDGRALIYPNRPHVFWGESESLKSWAALVACKSVLAAGLTALYIDFESSEPSFIERARHVGIPDDAIGGTLRYVRPNEPLIGHDEAGADFGRELFAVNGLVVLDGVTEAYALHDWNINKAEDAARFQSLFGINRIAASIAIDHTSKDAGRGVIGSQHKRAGLDGAEYEFRSLVRGGRGGTSLAEISITKDRHGRIREWADHDAVGHFEVALDGVSLRPVPLSNLVDPRDDALDRVVAFLVENPGSSGRQIATGVRLGAERVSDALSALAAQQRVRNEGSGRKHAWVVLESS